MVTKKPKGLGMGLEALLGPKAQERSADDKAPFAGYAFKITAQTTPPEATRASPALCA